MKRMIFALLVMVTLLSACAAPENPTLEPVKTAGPVLPSDTASAPAMPSDTAAAPDPKLPAAPFEAQTYVSETFGFALDYPAGWTVNEMLVGDRGTQIQFLSSPELAEAPVVPEGATRVNVTIYRWEPKNDLAAFIANQKTAWENSGITILDEEPLILEQGLPAVRFHVQTPDADVIFLMAALGDQYLVMSGEGDLELVRQIVERLRPINR